MHFFTSKSSIEKEITEQMNVLSAQPRHHTPNQQAINKVIGIIFDEKKGLTHTLNLLKGNYFKSDTRRKTYTKLLLIRALDACAFDQTYHAKHIQCIRDLFAVLEEFSPKKKGLFCMEAIKA